MQLEQVQLAIRPRTILECFDVTFLFCSRHWLGLSLAAAVGIIPLASLNWWLAGISEMNGYAAYLLLAIELPWATMFITLYLGQTIFSQRLSLRRMLRDGLSAVPSLLAYQLFVRGMCLLLVVLVPVVFLGMYYVNEIILLEKTPLARAWNRRSSMNARIMGRIVAMRLLELAVLVVGTYALAALFRAISALWEDRIDDLRWRFLFAESAEDFMIVTDWQLHAAFWVVIVFLTVFRFVTYLDCRIRREGWDVELKLRAQAELYRQREAVE